MKAEVGVKCFTKKVIMSAGNDSLGEGPIKFEWQPGGSYLAVCGSNGVVKILDRNCTVVSEHHQQGKITAMAWDNDGDLLAIANDKMNSVTLWEKSTKKVSLFDSGMSSREILVFMLWSKTSPILAVASSKGNLVLYNHRTARKIPVLGKHQRAVTCGAFSDTDLLALGADDATVTVSNMNGDTIYSFACNTDPFLLKFREIKRASEKNAKTDTMEMFSTQDFKSYLSCLCVSERLEQAFIIGDNQLKVREIHQLANITGLYEIEGEDRGLTAVDVNHDGQFMALSGQSGMLQVYLTKMPILGCSCRDNIAILSSLNEITVLKENEKNPVAVLQIQLEPSVIGLGPLHVAVAMNNRAWLYELSDKTGKSMVCEFEYISTVNAMQLNREFIVAFLDGRAQLHKMKNKDGSYDSEESSLLFPDPEKGNFRLRDMGLSNDFFTYCTDGGHLEYFSLDDWAYVNEFRHITGFTRIFLDPEGMRLCCFDEHLDAYIYNPINDALLKVPSIESTAHFTTCLWEIFTVDKDTFAICDSKTIYVFCISKNQVDGQILIQLGTTEIPFGHIPLILSKGIVHCQTRSGRMGSILLESHKIDMILEGKPSSTLDKLLEQSIKLKRYIEDHYRWLWAWKICEQSKLAAHWRTFAKASLQNIDIDIAIRIHKQIDEVGIVWYLEELSHIEEENLLAGHLALIMEQYDIAEKLFLQSSRPQEALEMRRDLLHWDKALILANRLAPEQIPYISKEYAIQLDFMGEYKKALGHFEKGVIEIDENASEELLDHNEMCKSGIARMSIRNGDIRRGVRLAMEIDGRDVKRECAIILENLKQYAEAAQLYEFGRYYDRAAAACIKSKNWIKLAELMPNVKSPKIYSQFGKIMEAGKKYKQAAIAYKNARDYDNLVRILLDHLNRPEEAVRIVKSSRSVEGAKLVAKFFQKLGDQSSAIHFLVLSQCPQEAFQLAENEQKMEIYAEAIEDEGTIEQFVQLADYFLEASNFTEAGKYYYKAAYYKKAMECLLVDGENKEAMKIAITCAAESKNSELCQQLVDFLLGEKDGIPKDAKLLFRYYMALKMNREAARTAIVIARDEQQKGSYRAAHQLLFGMHQELKQEGIKVPAEMDNILMLLHSYLIVKSWVRRKEDMKAARTLIRVADNIHMFPAHAVPILTSSVIECTKAGLKNSAFKYAVQLLKPEYRKKIDEKYRKKIEALVRKSEKGKDEDDEKSPCPYCAKETEQYNLVCDSCKGLIPYCIITGKHITSVDFATCPSCGFPGFHSEFIKLIELKEICPMCEGELKNITPGDIKKYLNL